MKKKIFIFALVLSKILFSLSFVHGPRINAVFQDSAFFTVETDQLCNMTMRWGVENFPYDDSIVISSQDTFFVVVPDNLSDNRYYHYSVSIYHISDTLTSPDRPFKTPVQAGQNFSFIILGDSQAWGQTAPTPEVFKKMIKMIDVIDPDFVILLGDAIYGSDDSIRMRAQWDDWKVATDTLAYSTPIYMVIGNHDANTYNQNYDGGRILASEFEMPHNAPMPIFYDELVYYFTWGDATFFIMDSDYYCNPSVIDIIQRNWLDSLLSQCTTAHRFVAQHEHAWAPYGDSSGFLGEYPADRDAYWSILREGGVKLDFCGHIHLYNSDFFNVSLPDTVKEVLQLVSGGAGGHLVSGHGGDFYHFCHLGVYGESVHVEVIDSNGVVQDSFPVVGVDETSNTEVINIYWIEKTFRSISGYSPTDISIVITDISGRIILSKNLTKGEYFNFIPDRSGIYFISCHSDNQYFTDKFLSVR